MSVKKSLPLVHMIHVDEDYFEFILLFFSTFFKK